MSKSGSKRYTEEERSELVQLYRSAVRDRRRIGEAQRAQLLCEVAVRKLTHRGMALSYEGDIALSLYLAVLMDLGDFQGYLRALDRYQMNDAESRIAVIRRR